MWPVGQTRSAEPARPRPGRAEPAGYTAGPETRRRAQSAGAGVKNSLTRLDFWGWVLFLACAAVFVGVGVRDDDAAMIVGSLLFVMACVLFLVPYVR